MPMAVTHVVATKHDRCHLASIEYDGRKECTIQKNILISVCVYGLNIGNHRANILNIVLQTRTTLTNDSYSSQKTKVEFLCTIRNDMALLLIDKLYNLMSS